MKIKIFVISVVTLFVLGIFLVYLEVIRPIREKGLFFWNLSEPQIMEKCRRYMFLDFPKSTRFVAVWGTPLMEIVIQLKIEMDKKDLDLFLKHSPFAGKPLNEDISKLGMLTQSTGLPWWTPEIRKIYKAGEVEVVPVGMSPKKKLRGTLYMFIELYHDKTITVYLLYCGP